MNVHEYVQKCGAAAVLIVREFSPQRGARGRLALSSETNARPVKMIQRERREAERRVKCCGELESQICVGEW